MAHDLRQSDFEPECDLDRVVEKVNVWLMTNSFLAKELREGCS